MPYEKNKNRRRKEFQDFNPKAVSKLMGHAKEIITMDVYGDNKGIIADGVPEIEAYIKEVLPNPEKMERFQKELLEIVADVTEFLPDTGRNKRTNVCFALYFLYGIWYNVNTWRGLFEPSENIYLGP